MGHHSGKCHGGPQSGMMMSHWADRKEFFEPVLKFALVLNPAAMEIIPHKIGEYYWGKHGFWVWLPGSSRSRRSLAPEQSGR